MSAHYRDAVVDQPSLDFAAKDQTAATRLRSDFLAALSDGQWHLGKCLLRDLGTNERVLRAIADKSAGAVISSDKGYKLTAKATVEEIDHAERRLLSQARKMQERAVEIRRARNGRAVA